MPAIKSIRLSKAAKDLNIGLHRIVEFLESKDIEIASSPNAKIPPEAYELLEDEFGKHKKDKAEAEEITSQKHHNENVVHEATALSPLKKKTEPEPELDENLERNLQEIKFGAGVAPPPKTEDNKEEVIKAQPETNKPKVVGKIDVSTPKKTVKKEEEPVADNIPVAEDKPVEVEKPKPEDEVIKATITKLKSPTILGKIELPKKIEKKKPVASSSNAVETEKPKRRKKRIRTDKPGYTPTPKQESTRDKKGKKAPVKKVEVTEKEIQDQIKSTLQRLSGAGKSKAVKFRKQKREAAAVKRQEEMEAQVEASKVIQVTEFVTVSELAILLNVPVSDIIAACMSLGLMVSINQRLDAETLTIVAEEFGSKVEFVSAEVQEAIKEEDDNPDDLASRPPIVTVMGHVDHGKTSLLDYVRDTNVIAGEAGGITQHIGAYEVTLKSGKQITFLDTPGHEAFTAMRARGAKVTDVAIIVIAADDSVMPQTVEAINHAQAAEVPIVFAFNKIDKPNANVEKIKEELANMKILVEDWGGKFQSQEISAKQGKNIEELLEKVLLEAELLEVKANPTKNAFGTVLESTLDKGKGHVTTVLILNGTLRIGDIIIAGPYQGRVKAMFNERGSNVKEAGPAVPVTILGLSGAPQAGDTLNVIDDEQEAKGIANKRMQLQREQGIRTTKHITLDEIGRRLAIGNFKELNVIVKGDVDGSIEALTDSLQKLSTEQVQVNVIHKSVGQISESDVLLASASNAIIIGFQVRPSVNARKLAEKEQIDIRLYSVIYDAINEVKAAMEGMLTPEYEEKIVCNVEVRDIFKIPKVGTVAGCMVLDGKVTRNTKIRVIRDGIVTYTGELSSLKRFKDDVKDVSSGYECGLSVHNFNDIKVGDIVEGYEQVTIKATL